MSKGEWFIEAKNGTSIYARLMGVPGSYHICDVSEPDIAAQIVREHNAHESHAQRVEQLMQEILEANTRVEKAEANEESARKTVDAMIEAANGYYSPLSPGQVYAGPLAPVVRLWEENTALKVDKAALVEALRKIAEWIYIDGGTKSKFAADALRKAGVDA